MLITIIICLLFVAEIEAFAKQQKSENTARETASDPKTFQHYLTSINKGHEQILHLPAGEPDHVLAKFLKDVSKSMEKSMNPIRFQIPSKVFRDSF